jgi:hypothetical protein
LGQAIELAELAAEAQAVQAELVTLAAMDQLIPAVAVVAYMVEATLQAQAVQALLFLNMLTLAQLLSAQVLQDQQQRLAVALR